jgi:anti-anti-sigma factor
MSVSTKVDGDTLTIKVDGRFDFSVHQEFRMAYENVSPAPAHYVVDLADTTYLDSSALGMLLLLRDYAGGDAADIELRNANEDVRKILNISNFEKLFRIA